MKTLMMRAIDQAQLRGAQYADIRITEDLSEFIHVKNGQPKAIKTSTNFGFGVRVLVGGSWGFASSSELSQKEIDRVTKLAIEIGKASALYQKEKVNLGSAVTSKGMYKTPLRVDPFTIPIEEKLNVLMQADAELARVEDVKIRSGQLFFRKEHKLFANSEGAMTDQTIYETGGGITAWAVGEGEVQIRSYPNSFGRNQVCAGYEIVTRVIASKSEKLVS